MCVISHTFDLIWVNRTGLASWELIHINIKFTPYTLPLASPWRSTHSNLLQRKGWLVSASDGSGCIGAGDCAPFPEAGTESREQASEFLQNGQIRNLPGDQDAQLSLVREYRTTHPAIACGLETALLDLYCQQSGRALARHLHPRAARVIEVNAALGPLKNASDVEVREALAQGFRVLKFKVGLGSIEQELQRLRQVAGLLGGSRTIRLDANRAWSLEEAGKFLDGLGELPVESLEEPLHEPGLDSLRALQGATNISVALDESLPGLGVEAILRATPVKRLIIKPMVTGGLLPGMDLAKKAADAGIECVVTSTVDSAVGVWAAVHLAAAVDALFPGLAHGLATSSWLQKDIASPPALQQGHIFLPETPGLGSKPHELSTLGSDPNVDKTGQI